MPQWDESERRLLGELERDLGSAELSAVLSEWITTAVHRVGAVTAVLSFWRTQLIVAGYSPQAVDASLPSILDRLWSVDRQPLPMDEVMDLLSIRIDEERDTDDEEEE